MGESKCKYCDEAATVHVNLILNGESHKIHLCQACAEQKGVTGTEAFSLMDIEESFSGVTPAEKRKNGGAVCASFRRRERASHRRPIGGGRCR